VVSPLAARGRLAISFGVSIWQRETTAGPFLPQCNLRTSCLGKRRHILDVEGSPLPWLGSHEAEIAENVAKGVLEGKANPGQCAEGIDGRIIDGTGIVTRILNQKRSTVSDDISTE
jgi:hypothetical protein